MCIRYKQQRIVNILHESIEEEFKRTPTGLGKFLRKCFIVYFFLNFLFIQYCLNLLDAYMFTLLYIYYIFIITYAKLILH